MPRAGEKREKPTLPPPDAYSGDDWASVDFPAERKRLSEFPVPRFIVIASGPSVTNVNPFCLGEPVGMISTVVRNPIVAARCKTWFLADDLNANHGTDGRIVWRDPSVEKLVPHWLRAKNGENITRVDYVKSWQYEQKLMKQEGRAYMDGKLPLLRDTHKSITFAIQWLATQGYRTIVICGCDLRTGPRTNQKYAYYVKPGDRNLNSMTRSLRKTYESMQRMHAAAKERGIHLVSWSPGSRLDEFMETLHAPPDQEAPGSEQGAVPEVRSGGEP